MFVWNIRLNRRGGDSGPPSFGQIEAEPLDDGRVAQVADRQPLGARQLVESVAAMARPALDQRVAERLPTWPDVTQTWGCMRIPASSPTMSSRSWTIARHQARLTLFFSSTPSGP